MIPGLIRSAAYDAYKKLETREHRLLYLFFEITRRCNLACRHCGSDCATTAGLPEMSTDSWLSVVDYLETHFKYKPFIVITGGEPTVRKDLFTIGKRLRERGFSWGMVTNGFLLNEAVISGLKEAGIASITLSFDGGLDAITYLRNHPHAYERCTAALDLVGASGIQVRDAVTCVYQKNIQDLDATAALLLDKGFTSWRLFRIFPSGRAAADPQLSLSAAQTRVLLDWIASERFRYKKKGLSISYSCEGYLPIAQDAKIRDEPFFCRSGINFASILCDGSIGGCNNNSPEFIQGNVARDDLESVWNDRFEIFRQRHGLRTGACEACGEWKHCQGGSMHLRRDNVPGPGFCLLAEERESHITNDS